MPIFELLVNAIVVTSAYGQDEDGQQLCDRRDDATTGMNSPFSRCASVLFCLSPSLHLQICTPDSGSMKHVSGVILARAAMGELSPHSPSLHMIMLGSNGQPK